MAESVDIVNVEAKKDYTITIRFDTSNLVPGIYKLSIQPYYLTETRGSCTVDEVYGIMIEVIDGKGIDYRTWARQYWGSIRLGDVRLINE